MKVWDVATGSALRTLTGHTSGVTSVAFSPDGTRLASASLGGSRARSGTRPTGAGKSTHAQRATPARVTSVAFSPDGTQLASASNDRTVKVWDAATGQEARTLSATPDVALRRDGVSDSARPRTIRRRRSVAFSPDGTRLASAGADGTVKVWDTTTGQEIRTFAGHTGRVWSVAFSPDGNWLASASEDRTVKLWDVATGQRATHSSRGTPSAVCGVAFSPDGKWLASASDDRPSRSGTSRPGRRLRTLTGHTDCGLRRGLQPRRHPARLGQRGPDRPALGRDDRPGDPLTSTGHTDSVSGVAFSPDGTRLASAAEDRTIKLWDVGDRPAKSAPSRATPPESSASPSAPTGGGSPRPARTGR